MKKKEKRKRKKNNEIKFLLDQTFISKRCFET